MFEGLGQFYETVIEIFIWQEDVGGKHRYRQLGSIVNSALKKNIEAIETPTYNGEKQKKYLTIYLQNVPFRFQKPEGSIR